MASQASMLFPEARRPGYVWRAFIVQRLEQRDGEYDMKTVIGDPDPKHVSTSLVERQTSRDRVVGSVGDFIYLVCPMSHEVLNDPRPNSN